MGMVDAGAQAGDRPTAVPTAAGHGRASVCVVIPTFNRRELLLETLDGLARQTRPVDGAVLVDNASTDGVAAAARDRRPTIEVLRFEDNSGSAGGFGRGARWAYEAGYDWIWLLDNDSEPEPGALDALLEAHARFPLHRAPQLLASKVVWTDGSILPLNVPIFKRKNMTQFYWAAEHATVSLRAAPYAGMLVHRDLLARHGVPLESYFFWNDDIEWTGRMLRNAFGVLVPASVICHKTPGNPTTTADAGPRFFYEIRNKLWMIRCSDAYRPMEKVRFLLTLGVDTGRYLRRTRPSWSAVWTVARATMCGLFTRPATAGQWKPAGSDDAPCVP